MHLIPVLISTWMQQLLCVALMANARTEKEFVFYGNLVHPSEGVKHMGDNRTGEGEGDDEQIEIDLTKIPANIERIAFTATIYDADVRRQNFRTGFQCLYSYRGRSYKSGADPL